MSSEGLGPEPLRQAPDDASQRSVHDSTSASKIDRKAKCKNQELKRRICGPGRVGACTPNFVTPFPCDHAQPSAAPTSAAPTSFEKVVTRCYKRSRCLKRGRRTDNRRNEKRSSQRSKDYERRRHYNVKI